MPTFTPNFSYSQPLVNNAVDADLWGGLLNSNWADIDTDLAQTAVNESSSFFVSSDSFNSTFIIDATGGVVTATLPAVTNVFSGFVVRFKAINVDNAVTVAANGSELIDGQSTIVISDVNGYVEVISDGVGWLLTTPRESTETVSGLVRKGTATEVASEDADTNITSDNGVNAPFAAKAWVNFSDVGGIVTVHDSYNVSSVARNSTGNYTINYSVTMVNANSQSVTAIGGRAAGSATNTNMSLGSGTPFTTTSVNVVNSTKDGTGVVVNAENACVTVFGKLV